MKVQAMSQKTVLIALSCVVLCLTGAATVWSAIPQMGIQCSNCHDGGMEKPLLPQYQGNAGCVNCHSSSTSSTTYDIDVGMGDTVTVPVVIYTGASAPTSYLASGNFWWVAQGDDSKGHNVFADNPDDNHAKAPGSAVGCDGIPGMCHQNIHQENTLGMPGLIGRQGCTKCHMIEDFGTFPPRGYHHANDSNLVVGSDVGDSDGYFRFLVGHQSGLGHGVCGIEDDDWQATSGPGDHNEYRGYSGSKLSAGSFSVLGHTMTAFCTGCHGNFHVEQSGADWVRHPSDAVLPDETPDSEYEGYTTYNPLAPVARPESGGTFDWSGPDSNVYAGTGQDMAMCLSCHRAHGSPYPHMLRWDPTETSANGSCATCHTRKQANTAGQYHKDDVADCNVCHAHHGAGADYNYDLTGNIKLIKKYVSTPNSGDKEVKLLRRTGANSFADGDSPYKGICEVCHTTTNYFRNASWVDPSSCAIHQNEYAGTDCIVCHPHEEGADPGLDEFLHGDDNPGQAAVCTDCHGHDDGYLSGSYYGSTFSHSTHTEDDTDDAKGPNIACSDCHDTSWYPCFLNGETKTNTDVCEDCHSPGGRVDGIDDADIGAKPNWSEAVYNATGDALKAGKEAWCAGCHDDDPTTDANESAVIDSVYAPGIAGVSLTDAAWYSPDNAWIGTVSGVALPNLVDGNTGTGNARPWREAVFDLGGTYLITDLRMYIMDAGADGITWHVYAGDGSTWTRVLGSDNPLYGWKTGHAGAGWYQAKVNVFVRAQYVKLAKSVGPCLPNTLFEVEFRKDNLQYGYFDTGHKIACSNCHDFTAGHIDGVAKTYSSAADNYQAGFRLETANEVPREIPEFTQGVDENDFALCFKEDCHAQAAFTDGSNMTDTNFRDDDNAMNDHYRHLQIRSGYEWFFDSDFNGTADSDMTCSACHNVHGSPTPGMVRHGELFDQVPGLNLRYLDINGDPDGDIAVGDSTGAETYYWGPGSGSVSKNGICLMCHNDAIRYERSSVVVDPPSGFQVISLCPVDLRIIDPEGLIIDKFLNEIVGASYFEGDIDGDGSADDRILIPRRKTGEYTILVLPESDPDPGDKDVYTLKAMIGNATEILAQDTPIGEPDTHDQYTVELAESGIVAGYTGSDLTAIDDGQSVDERGGGSGCFIDSAGGRRL